MWRLHSPRKSVLCRRARGLGLAAVVLLLVGLAPRARAEEATDWSAFTGYPAVVIGDVCNLRAGPGTSWRVLGQVRRGDRLQIRGAQGAWVRVDQTGGEAWIAGWLIEVDLGSRGSVAVVERANVNLRAGPGLNFRVVGMTTRGERFPAEARRGNWIRVHTGAGSAWVWEPLVSLVVEEPPASPGPESQPTATPTGDTVGAQSAGLLVYPMQKQARVCRTATRGSAEIGTLTSSRPGRYLGSAGGWVWVELGGSGRGWVWGPEVRLEHPRDRQVLYRVSDSAWTIEKCALATVTATNVNFRSGPGTGFEVVGRVDRGDLLRVLESANGWIKAVDPRGRVGWVAGWLTSGVKPPRDRFLVSLRGGNVSRHLTVSGTFDSAQVVPHAGGRSLLVTTSGSFSGSGTLEVGAYEVERVHLMGSDVRVDFLEQPFFQVVENLPGRVVVELRPAVTSVSLRQEAGRDVLSVTVLGYAWPGASRNGDGLDVFIPGATFSGERSTLRGGIVKAASLEQVDGGVVVRLHAEADTACRVKKGPNLLELHFFAPGLEGKTVVIDPGHGGDDPGAVGPTGLMEKTVNWEIARRLAQLLRAEGARVELTRERDSPSAGPGGGGPDRTSPAGEVPAGSRYEAELARRAAWSEHADVFISVHNDSHPNRTASGTTTYFCSGTLNGAESARLARLMQAELTGELGTLDRGVSDSSLFVLRHSACPAALVEVMYLSHPREELLLRQDATLDKAAHAILRALQRYFGAGTL